MTRAPNDNAQSKAFIAAAKAAECDEDEVAWDRRLKAVVKAPVTKDVPAPKKRAKAAKGG